MGMTPTVNIITISDTASARLRELQPERIMPRLARRMDQENVHTVSYIQTTYLSFPKSEPSVPDGLRVQTNRLRGSLRASSTVITGDGLQSAIGSNVVYAALHEFGGVIHHPARKGSVRLRTDGSGNLLRTGPNGKLAIFARQKGGYVHKQFKTVQYAGKEYDVTYPARAYVRNGLRDCAGNYLAAFEREIMGGNN